MDWSNEPYVRVYTRETDDDLALSWEAMAIWNQLMKRFERSGIIATKRGARGLAAVVRIPAEIVERHLPELIADGRLREIDGGYIAPNFLEAQTASKSDKLRQKEARERRRSSSLDVTNRDSDVTKRDGSVTDGHAASLFALHCSADPLQSRASSPARAIPPPPPPPTSPTLPRSEIPEHRAQQIASPPELRDRRIKLNHDAWQYAALKHAELRGDGIDPNAIPWPVMPAGEPAKDLIARTAELLALRDPPDIRAVEEVMRRRVDVVIAESRREGHLRWFTPSLLWDAKKFYRAIEINPVEAAQRRGPHSSPNGSPAPMRIKRADDAMPPLPPPMGAKP